MELEGKLWKEKSKWLIEVSSLDLMTQGNTENEALEMIADAIESLIECYFPEAAAGFKVNVTLYEHGIIGVSATCNSIMLALSLKRQREKCCSTVREVAERLGSSSPNAYARYEKGRTRISLDQYERLLKAVNPKQNFHLRVV